MQDSSVRKPDEQPADADATSKETLEDLEDSEQDSEAKVERDNSPVPSPDGAQPENRKPADDAGPM